MDSRGYGRRAHHPAATRRLSGGGVLIGLGAAVVGTYQVISAGGGHRVGLALLVRGHRLALVAGFVAGRGCSRPATGRTRGAARNGWSSVAARSSR